MPRVKPLQNGPGRPWDNAPDKYQRRLAILDHMEEELGLGAINPVDEEELNTILPEDYDPVEDSDNE